MFADRALADRLHAQHRWFFSGLVDAARAVGLTGEPMLELEGSFAFFAGDGSPLTQGGGTFEADDLVRISEFYRGRATSWEAVVNPFDGTGALQRLIEAGGKAEGWESVLYSPLPPRATEGQGVGGEGSIDILEVGEKEMATWSDVGTRGFFGGGPSPVATDLARLLERAKDTRRYLAYCDGTPAAAASLTLGCGIAFFGGMATLPEFRGRGIQSALIQRRLQDAIGHAELAVVGARQDSTSHRNAERAGFRIAFAQLSIRVPAS